MVEGLDFWIFKSVYAGIAVRGVGKLLCKAHQAPGDAAEEEGKACDDADFVGGDFEGHGFCFDGGLCDGFWAVVKKCCFG